MKLEQRSGVVEFNENEVTVTLDLRQSKKFHNAPFETESIDAELFVRSIESEAPILFNHKREQIVSDDYDVETAEFTSPIWAKSSLVFDPKTESPVILPFIILFISLASSKLWNNDKTTQ